MEFSVEAVGSINNCFVSLPLPLIQTLQSTASSHLPPILALHLRSPTHPPHSWFVAWSGATSSSSSTIQVSQQFAECVSLPIHSPVQVQVASNVPHASSVSIEPHTEDDWEILELNSEQAEDQILNQVFYFVLNSIFSEKKKMIN
jgi:peroxin-1